MRLRIKKRNMYLVLLIIMNFSFFYVFSGSTKIAGISLDDIALMLAILWGSIEWIKLSGKPNPKFKFGCMMFSLIILVILSSLQSWKLYGQGILLGVQAQRFQIVWALLYFPITKLLYYDKLRVDEIKKMIRLLGIVQLVLFIVQYIVGNQFLFLQVQAGQRYGEARYYFLPTLLDLALFLELDNLFNKEKKMTPKEKILPYFIIVGVLFETMVVQKFRLTSIALIVCIIIALLLNRASVKIKISYLLIGVVFIMVMFNTQIVQDVITEFFTGVTNSGTASTMTIRQTGRELYLSIIAQHPILGGGYPHQNCIAACEAAGMYNRIYLVDNGMFGFAYVFGGLGIAWILVLWGMMFYNAWKIYRKRAAKLLYGLFPLFFIFTGMNEIHWYWEAGFMIMSIFLALFSEEIF